MIPPDRNREKLHPILRHRFHRFETAMNRGGFPIRLLEGWRSLERQAELYAQGRTAPGSIVTRAKPGESNHNPDTDGFGRACDFGFEGPEPFAEWHPWAMAGTVAELCELEWGGRWTRPDRPHLQLPKIVINGGTT